MPVPRQNPRPQVLLTLHARHGVVHGVAGHDAVDLDHGITLRGQIHTDPGRQLVSRRVQGAIDNSTRWSCSRSRDTVTGADRPVALSGLPSTRLAWPDLPHAQVLLGSQATYRART